MNKSYSLIIVFLVLTGAILSCSEMNDLHQPYLDEGEKIYPGKVDTVIALPGDSKLILKKVFKADPNIVSCTMYWNNQTDSLNVPVAKTTGIDTVSTTLNNLEEGSYLFELYTFDADGNRSVKVEKSANVYGDIYKSSLINRGIQKIESPEPGITVITWKKAEDGNTCTKLSYQSNSGEQTEVVVPSTEDETILDDFTYGGTVSYQSFYKPVEEAIDEFEAQAEEFALPEDFLVNKGNISVKVLPTDCAGTCWGGDLNNLFDGQANDAYYHTGCAGDGTDGIPHHFTLDLGNNLGLKRFSIAPRTGCCQGRNPKKIQIWGCSNIEDAETTLLSGDAGWETEAAEKGWIKLFEGETPASFNGSASTVELAIPENEAVRYVRYRCLSNWNGEPYTALSEITFWADRIE